MRTQLDIRQIKQIQLEILKTVASFCEEHKIKYFLAYGTLLGAVRHKGYIPWDDDIDVMMPREDYERFLREFNADRTDELQALHCSIDHDFPYYFAKVHHKNTRLIENVDHKYNMGINIDVFVIDYIGNEEKNARKMIGKIRKWKLISDGKKIYPNRAKKRSFPKNVIVTVWKKLSSFFSVYQVTGSVEKIAKKYIDCRDSKFVADICGGEPAEKAVFNAEWFKNTAEAEFEGRKFKAPQDFHEVLSRIYGDYMKLPPKEERITHHDYTAYLI